MSSTGSPSVLIVGAGPVGLTMAIELTRFGVPVRIIDRAPKRSDKSKALVIWPRTLELLQRSGATEALVAAGYKVDAVTISAEKRAVGHLTMEALPSEYRFVLMIPQSETERVLDQHLNNLGVHIDREIELASFTDDGNDVTAKLRHADGTEERMQTPWLIGCDGAHSAVRHLLGKEFYGETSLTDWLLADVHLVGVPRTPEVTIGWHAEGVLATFTIAKIGIA